MRAFVRALRRLSARRSSSLIPPHTPASWPESNAQVRHSVVTGQRYDVDPSTIAAAGIAPSDRIVTHRAAALLEQSAAHGEARIVEIDERHEPTHLLAVEQLGVDAVQPHSVAAPRKSVALRVGVKHVEHAALADHGVVVEVLLQPLPQFHRPFVEGEIAGQQIIGADDGGVAPDIAGADIGLLDHGDIGDAVFLGEVMRGGEPVAAAADDDHVVSGLRLRLPPDRLPVRLPVTALTRRLPSE